MTMIDGNAVQVRNTFASLQAKYLLDPAAACLLGGIDEDIERQVARALGEEIHIKGGAYTEGAVIINKQEEEAIVSDRTHLGLSPQFDMKWDQSGRLKERLLDYLKMFVALPATEQDKEIQSKCFAQMGGMLKRSLVIDGRLNTELADFFDKNGFMVTYQVAHEDIPGVLAIDFQSGKFVWSV